jgi:hypothetical protein
MIALLLAVALADKPLESLAKPDFLPREEWKASPAIPGMKPHVRKVITIHHGGVVSKPNIPTATKIKNLQTWSQRADKLASGKEKPAWPDVPYHYWIGWDGKVAVARDDGFVGDTNTEYDPTGHVLICLEGNFEEETPTEPQMDSLRKLSLYLAVKYKIASADIQTHRDYSKQTTCPGDHLYREMDSLRWFVVSNRR